MNSSELVCRGIKVIDYFKREELQILDAIPTAEGAVQIAMDERPYTISGSNCLVIGYGRIGKILSSMLKALNARVTVSARKCEDLAWIRAYGMIPHETSKISEIIPEQDIIFNTVPSLVIGSNELAKAKKTALLVDLASKPGGIDFDEAKNYGIDTVWSLSLPGKVAPVSAGGYICDTIMNIIEQEERDE